MANRRLLDQSHHRNAALDMRCNRSIVVKTKIAYLNLGTLLLSLVIVSCLILTDCASHGHHLNKRQWRNNQPEYLISSMPLERADIEWDIDVWPHHLQQSNYRQPPVETSQASYKGLPYDSVNVDTQPMLSDSDQQLFQQLLLARPFSGSKLVTQPTRSAQSGYLTGNSEQQQLDDYRTAERLAELIEADRSPVRESQRSLSRYDLTDSRDSPADTYIQPSLSFVLPPDLNKIQPEPNLVEPNVVFGREEQTKNEYRVREEGNDYKRGDDKQQQITTSLENTPKETHGQLTTLLENEANEKTEEAQVTGASTTTISPRVIATTTAVYGTVLNGQPELHHKDNQVSVTSAKNDGSIFGHMYKKLSGYLPFLQQLGLLKNPTVKQAESKTTTNKSSHGSAPLSESKVESENSGAQASNEDKQHQEDDTKQRASGSQTDEANTKLVQVKGSSEDNNSNQEDKQTTNDRIQQQQQKEGYDGFEADSTKPVRKPSIESDSGGARIIAINQSDDNEPASKRHPQQVRSTKTVSLHMPHGEVHIEEHLPSGEDDDRKVSMFRQSSMSIPFASEDQYSEGTGSGSLLGKYIYAPEHHYHLNTGSEPVQAKVMDMNDEQVSHRSYSRHLRPGDSVYSSFNGGARPLYGGQGEEGVLGPLGVQNKSNDLYFLVMVAAFCVMAMAVVLSAGLFAYRVQQSRKTTTEPDYPTYGVVGPNNMSAKCGAAGFMGGYFGAAGPDSSMPGSKTGSTKQLADTCSTSDSGVVVGNNMVNNKSVSKRVSNDPSGNPGNFMANQNAARMYHYQHQKQQMIISDHASTGRHTSASDLDSEDENDDGSYTVYECPGLASAHEMEIKNPLFNDDRTP